MALLPAGLAFYSIAAAACALNFAAVGAIIRGGVRSTPLFHTLVMLLTWALYQCAFRVFTDHEASNVAASPWAPPCGFSPNSLSFDPGENSRICTGFIGSVERWMLLHWQFPGLTGGEGNTTTAAGGGVGVAAAAAAGEERARALMGERFVWWPTLACCIITFAVGAFADVIGMVMRRMQLRARRRQLRRRA
ncbi:unnamed protein product [Urochloa decumbens]|uniref:Uncharacterized protein n=1 Tax=Urochloa decumbens TaxID=240449 RepID=A0ABC9BBS0_9POAL